MTSRHAIRVVLPHHLRTLAGVGAEAEITVEGSVTLRAVLDALEARYPMLRGTIREHGTLQRRAFLRFFACEEDLSLESPDAELPVAVASGKEPLVVLGAIAGGLGAISPVRWPVEGHPASRTNPARDDKSRDPSTPHDFAP